MEEIDAQGRQLLIDRPALTKGRLTVFRQSASQDDWFPRLNVTLKKAGSDLVLWQWTSHSNPVDMDEPPPYLDELVQEKYFELDSPLKSPRGLETVFSFGPGATNRGSVEKFSASLYLYPGSLEERGVQVGVVDFPEGMTAKSVPLYFRINFPW